MLQTKYDYYGGWGGEDRSCSSGGRNMNKRGYRPVVVVVGTRTRGKCYRRDRARSRKRIASAWFRISGEEVPPSSVSEETSPASSPDACRRDAAEMGMKLC